MRKKGMITAVCAVVLGTVVAAGGLITCKDAAIEWWYLHKLRTTQGAERDAAAETLAAMRSLRAVPELLKVIRGDASEQVTRQSESVPARCSKGAWLGYYIRVETRVATPVIYALWSYGDAAFPGLEKALNQEAAGTPESERVRSILTELLDRSTKIVQVRDVVLCVKPK